MGRGGGLITVRHATCAEFEPHQIAPTVLPTFCVDFGLFASADLQSAEGPLVEQFIKQP